MLESTNARAFFVINFDVLFATYFLDIGLGRTDYQKRGLDMTAIQGAGCSDITKFVAVTHRTQEILDGSETG